MLRKPVYTCETEVQHMKTVLITGAGGGMGKAAVDLFVQSGYRVLAADIKLCEERENVVPLYGRC